MEIFIAIILVSTGLYLFIKSLKKSVKGGCNCSEKECSNCPSKNNIEIKNK